VRLAEEACREVVALRPLGVAIALGGMMSAAVVAAIDSMMASAGYPQDH